MSVLSQILRMPSRHAREVLSFHWVEIAQCPPEFMDGREVLVWSNGYPFLARYQPGSEAWGHGGRWQDECGQRVDPSHVMALTGPNGEALKY